MICVGWLIRPNIGEKKEKRRHKPIEKSHHNYCFQFQSWSLKTQPQKFKGADLIRRTKIPRLPMIVTVSTPLFQIIVPSEHESRMKNSEISNLVGLCLIVIELSPPPHPHPHSPIPPKTQHRGVEGTKTLQTKPIRYCSQILIPAEIQCPSSSTVSTCGGILLGSAVVPVMIPFAARLEVRPQ